MLKISLHVKVHAVSYSFIILNFINSIFIDLDHDNPTIVLLLYIYILVFVYYKAFATIYIILKIYILLLLYIVIVRHIIFIKLNI